MASNFMNTVQVDNPKGNIFDLGHDHKLSCDMGNLIPFYVQDTLPGDKFTVGAEIMARFQALMAPTMHRFDVFSHYFYVPNRIVWPGWQDFLKSINDGENAPAFPYLSNFEVPKGSLADYLGLPLQADANIDKVSAIPFAAYQMIYNEYYRDQNLQNEVNFELTDGDNSGNWYQLSPLRRRAWVKDFFTSQLPNAQKGQPVTIPLGDVAPVKLRDNYSLGSQPAIDENGNYVTGVDLAINGLGQLSTGTSTGPRIWLGDQDLNTPYEADLQSATAIDVNALRTAFRVQEWLERAARVGTRYTEIIRGFFGVVVPDATLQRPLYLGGSKQPMVVSEVLQTSETTESSPQGDMAGHGISIGGGKSFSYRCTEHGYIIGLLSIMPKTAYQQGIEAHFSKFDPVDFGWPQFSQLGEQPVPGRQVYYAEGDPQNDTTFGYQPIYGEYRTKLSRVSGDMAADLNYWHAGRIFANRPFLNADFIECNPTKRIFTVQANQGSEVLCQIYNHVMVYRLLPKFGTPKLI